MSLRIFKYFFRCRYPMILFLISIATASSSAFLLRSTTYSNLSFIKTCCKGEKWKVNHCDYFEIYLKAKSLRRLHIRNKKGKFRQVSLFFFYAWLALPWVPETFHARVFGFGTRLFCDPPEKLFLAAFSAWGQPRSIFIALNRRTRDKTSGTQSSLASLQGGHVTRNDSQRRFLAQHSTAMLEHCCNYSKQCCNAMLR